MTAPLRHLGSSDLRIPPLVLGGNVFGWTADRKASFAILDAFVDAAVADGGAVMIDTADVYSAWVPGHHGGESESVIGDWLRGTDRRERVLVATKVGMLPGEGGEKLVPARITAACDESLRRLGTDHIDLFYAHQDDEAVPQHDYLAAFGRLVDTGKVRVVGASNFGAARLQSALDLAKADSGLARFDVLQPEYNLVSRNRFEGDLQDLCVRENIAVLPYYGLASGFLTGKYRSAEDFGKSVRGNRMQPFLDGKGPAVLAALDAVAAETGASLAQISLAWLMAQDAVAAPIASVTSVDQLRDLLPAMTLDLSSDQLDRLTAAGA